MMTTIKKVTKKVDEMNASIIGMQMCLFETDRASVEKASIENDSLL